MKTSLVERGAFSQCIDLNMVDTSEHRLVILIRPLARCSSVKHVIFSLLVSGKDGN